MVDTVIETRRPAAGAEAREATARLREIIGQILAAADPERDMAALAPALQQTADGWRDVRRLLVSPYMREGRFAPAAAALGMLIAAYPERADDRRVLASLLGRMGEWDRAIAEADAAAGIEPGNAALHAARIQLRVQAGRVPEAAEVARTTLALARSEPGEAHSWMMAFARNGDAAEEADIAAALDPDKLPNERVATMAVRALMEDGRNVAAIGLGDAALRAGQDCPALRSSLGLAHLRRGTEADRKELAVAHFEAGLQAAPEDVRLLTLYVPSGDNAASPGSSRPIPCPPATTGSASAPARTKVCGSAGPRSWSQARVGPASYRIAVTFASFRAARSLPCASASAAPGSSPAVWHSAPESRATVTAAIPPGCRATTTASPRGGSAHSAAPSSSSPSAAARPDRKYSVPSGPNTGPDSPLSDRVSRSASRSPVGSISHRPDTNRVPSPDSTCTAATRRVPSTDSARELTRGQATRADRSRKVDGPPEDSVMRVIVARSRRRRPGPWRTGRLAAWNSPPFSSRAFETAQPGGWTRAHRLLLRSGSAPVWLTVVHEHAPPLRMLDGTAGDRTTTCAGPGAFILAHLPGQAGGAGSSRPRRTAAAPRGARRGGQHGVGGRRIGEYRKVRRAAIAESRHRPSPLLHRFAPRILRSGTGPPQRRSVAMGERTQGSRPYGPQTHRRSHPELDPPLG